jgi:hypothetical protein
MKTAFYPHVVRINLIVWLILLAFYSQAQDALDRLMVNRPLDCSEVSYNCSLLFQKYLEEIKVDSARQIVYYWKKKCGDREPVFRARILLSLIERNYHDSLTTMNSINHLFNYQNRVDMVNTGDVSNYDYYKPYYGYVPVGSDFDNFTKDIAKELMKNYSENSIEYLLAEFYGYDPTLFFEKVQNLKFQNTTWYNRYQAYLDENLALPDFNLSWITGLWIPTGQIEVLGPHPDIGFQMGIKKRKMNYDLTMTFKFGDAKNAYWATRTNSGNTKELTKNFFGGYIGFDVGYDVYVHKHHEIQLLSGIALDGFDALEETGGLPAESVLTYNINFGAGYRYYLTNSFYLGLRGKFNIVDYTVNNVVDINGIPVTLQLVVGGLTNRIKSKNLADLKYTGRR